MKQERIFYTAPQTETWVFKLERNLMDSFSSVKGNNITVYDDTETDSSNYFTF